MSPEGFILKKPPGSSVPLKSCWAEPQGGRKLDQSEKKWVKCRGFCGITFSAGLYNQPDSGDSLAHTHAPDHGHKWVKPQKRARAVWNITVCQRSRSRRAINQRGSSSTTKFMMWPSSWRRWEHWNIHQTLTVHLISGRFPDNPVISSGGFWVCDEEKLGDLIRAI